MRLLIATSALMMVGRLAGSALADPAGTPAVPLLVAGVPAPRSSAIDTDPDADHAWLSSTAETQPRGKLSISTYELLGYGMSYGLTDSTELSALFLPPIIRSQVYSGDISVKQRLLDGDLQLAVVGSVWHDNLSNTDSPFASLLAKGGAKISRSAGATVETLGAILGVCLDRRCRSQVGASATFATDGFASNESLVTMASHATITLAYPFKAVVELDGAAVVGQRTALVHAGLLFYGFRLAHRLFAVDVGMVRPIGFDTGDTIPAIGFPVLSLTYRP